MLFKYFENTYTVFELKYYYGLVYFNSPLSLCIHTVHWAWPSNSWMAITATAGGMYE